MKMIQFKSKFYRFLIILYSIVSIGSTVYLLLRPSENKTDIRYEQTKDELQHIKEYLKQKDSNYQNTIDSLKRESDSLQSVIASTDKRLNYSRSQVRSLSNQLVEYVDRYDSDSTLHKDEFAFDSLSEMSRDLITQSTIRDSLCDAEINSLKEVIVNKQNAFSNCDSLLTDYKSETDKLISQTQELNLQLKRAEKKTKRSRNINRLLSASVVVLSGIFITYQLLQ